MVIPLLLALVATLVVSVVARKIFFPEGPPWEDVGDGYGKYFLPSHNLLRVWLVQNLSDDTLDIVEAAKAVFCVYGPVVIGLLVFWIAHARGLP